MGIREFLEYKVVAQTPKRSREEGLKYICALCLTLGKNSVIFVGMGSVGSDHMGET